VTYTGWVKEEGDGEEEEEGEGGAKRSRGGSQGVKRRSKTIRRKTFKTWTNSINASSPEVGDLRNPLLPLESNESQNIPDYI